MVYAAKVKGERLNFRVSGMLWKRSLVMEDVETGSRWSHILGECMRGELKGVQLEIIPGEMVTWKDWKTRYPHTTVLDLRRTSKNYDKSFYRKPDRFVLGAVIDGKAMAYPFDVLESKKVIEGEIGSEPVLVTFDAESTRATLFSRRVGKRVLQFRYDSGKRSLEDSTTGSRWDPSRGRALSGPLEGKQLTMLPGIVSYRKSWRAFHPESGYAGSGDAGKNGKDEKKETSGK